jgi:hypothetical protein
LEGVDLLLELAHVPLEGVDLLLELAHAHLKRLDMILDGRRGDRPFHWREGIGPEKAGVVGLK